MSACTAGGRRTNAVLRDVNASVGVGRRALSLRIQLVKFESETTIRRFIAHRLQIYYCKWRGRRRLRRLKLMRAVALPRVSSEIRPIGYGRTRIGTVPTLGVVPSPDIFGDGMSWLRLRKKTAATDFNHVITRGLTALAKEKYTLVNEPVCTNHMNVCVRLHGRGKGVHSNFAHTPLTLSIPLHFEW